MIGVTLKRAVLIPAAAAACYGLAERFGVETAVAVWSATAALACAVGTVLLRTSPLGRVTWRNRAAGYLIPWGWRLNKGLLWPIPFISWAVWMAVGGAAVLVRPGHGTPRASASGSRCSRRVSQTPRLWRSWRGP